MTASPLVSTQWLADRLSDADVIAIDASWYLPAMQRDGHAEFLAGHIPGAVFFDIDAISDRHNPLPHMLPSPQVFAETVGGLGISDTMTGVVYDGAGLFSAARVWWMLRCFGMRAVHVLDGGLPRWKSQGYTLESGAGSRKPTRFSANFDDGAVATMGDVETALAQKSAQVADARPGPRFLGEALEPRAGLPSGHMPGALNLPIGDLVQNGALLDKAALEKVFAKAGFDPQKPAIASCGSGVSAAIINLALAVTGHAEPRLYDGSWTEWASAGKPIAKR